MGQAISPDSQRCFEDHLVLIDGSGHCQIGILCRIFWILMKQLQQSGRVVQSPAVGDVSGDASPLEGLFRRQDDDLLQLLHEDTLENRPSLC